jgi:hypothetical protein
MTIVRVIFVETTRPVRMRPRMETSPVKGHFLSDENNLLSVRIALQMRKGVRTDVTAVDRLRRGLEPKTDILIPPLLPSGDFLAAYSAARQRSIASSNDEDAERPWTDAPLTLAFWKRCCFW